MGKDHKKLQKMFPQKSKQECKSAIDHYGSIEAAADAFARASSSQTRNAPSAYPAGFQPQPGYHNQPPAYAAPYQAQPAYPPQQAYPQGYPAPGQPYAQMPQQPGMVMPQQPGMVQGQPLPAGAPGVAPPQAAPQVAQPVAGPDGVPVVQAVPAKASGVRRALLIGCNYRGQRGAQLNGCVNDVQTITNLLVNTYKWDYNQIRIMTDDTHQCLPTRRNIMDGMRWLLHGAKAGDVFFFSYSGHGAQKPDPNGFEEDGMNETLLPLDFKQAGMISDDEINAVLVQAVPHGAKLTAVIDACHSGTGLDLPFTWTMHGWQEETNPFHTMGDVQMFSGCADSDVSSDGGAGIRGGAMTNAICAVLSVAPNLSYPHLLESLHKTLAKYGYKQRPVLTSSQPFDFRRRFSLDEIIPNMNPYLGRIFRRRFKTKPNKKAERFMKDIGIGNVIAGAAAIGVGMLLMDAIF